MPALASSSEHAAGQARAEGIALQSQTSSQIPRITDVGLEELGGSFGTLNGTYVGKRRIVIVGRAGCANTQGVASQARQMAKQPDFADAEFFLLDCDSDRAAFAEAYGECAADGIHVCSPFEGSATDYSKWAFANWRAYSGEEGGVTLPWVFVVDAEGSVVKAQTGSQILADTVDAGYLGSSGGEELVSVHLRGVEWSNRAQELLALVNGERESAGVGELAWDSGLEAAAKQRAAEIALYFSHTRPDGSSLATALPAGAAAPIHAENIACGLYYLSAEHVNGEWKDSPGHYANMVNGGWRSMGAASFEAADNYLYWVECFSQDAGDGITGGFTSDKVVKTVEATGSRVSNRCAISSAGGRYSDGSWVVSPEGQDWSTAGFFTGVVDVSDFTWASSDESVLAITVRNGNAMLAEGRNPGKTVVTATLKSDPLVSLSMRVVVDSESDKKIGDVRIYEMNDQVYSGKQLTPRPDVWLSNVMLRTDAYELTYKGNVDVGYGTVIVRGVKPYYGEKTARFKIVPKGTEISAFKSNARGKATITWEKQRQQTDGYQVRYSLKKGMSKATVKTIPKTGTMKSTAKGLKKGKRYYAQVRTYKRVDGKVFASPWSKKKSAVIR